MSTVSAGLVKATNLTITGTQSGAVTATNFNTTNVNTENINASGAVKVGSATDKLYETNAPISDDYKNVSDTYARTHAWDSSRGQIGTGVDITLPYGNSMFTPCIQTQLYKNGDVHMNAYGIASWRDPTKPPDENTIWPILSMTKPVTAALYARFKTLGYISEKPTPLSAIWPVMNNITFQYPVYFDSSAAAIAAGYTVVGQVPTKLSDGVRNVVWKAGKYVGIGTPRTPYLDDVFSESVAFIGGFDYFFLINGSTYGEGLSSPDDRENVFFGGPKVLASLQGKKVSDYQKINIYRSDGSCNNVLDDPWTDTNNYFNKFVVDASNKAMNVCVLGYNHGVFNYNISGSFTTGALYKIYKDKFPSFTGSYYDILKKELLDPIGSNMFYWMNDSSDSRFYKLATSWTTSAHPNGTAGGYSSDGSGWIVNNGRRNGQYSTGYAVISPNDVSTSYDEGNIYSNHGSCLWRYHLNDASGYVPKLHLGNIGLLGTMNDYEKFGKLLMNEGVLPNGQRLISSKYLALMKTPRGIPSDYTESMCANFVITSATGVFAMGGASRGPSYNYITAIDNDNPMTSVEAGISIASYAPAYPANYAAFYDAPEDEFTWFGATGDAFFVCPKKGVVFQYSLSDNEKTPEYIFGPALEKFAQDEYMQSGAVSIYQAP